MQQSRFVLWGGALPAMEAASLPSVLRQAIACGPDALEAMDPTCLRPRERTALRMALACTGLGLEVLLVQRDAGSSTNAARKAMLRPRFTASLADVDFSVRTTNCLSRVGVQEVEQLFAWTPERLLQLPNMGSKSVDEVLDLLAELRPLRSFAAPLGEPNRKDREEAFPLAALLSFAEVLSLQLTQRIWDAGCNPQGELTAPAVSAALHAAQLNTAEKLAWHACLARVGLSAPPGTPEWMTGRVEDLRRVFRPFLDAFLAASLQPECEPGPVIVCATPAASLTEELARLIPSHYGESRRRIVEDLLGWSGGLPQTLEAVAQAQQPPLTRERVRQLAAPVYRSLGERAGHMPWLERTQDALLRLAPCRMDEAEDLLLGEGFVTARIRVDSILELYGRIRPDRALRVEGDLLVGTGNADAWNHVREDALKQSSRWGFADWRTVSASLGWAANQFRPLLPDAVWLDEDHRYCMFPSHRNSLRNRLVKVLHVAPELPLAEAQQAVLRDARMNTLSMPESLFAAFCKAWPWCTVDGDTLRATVELPPSEPSDDDLLVLLLQELRRPATRDEIIALAAAEGIGKATVSTALTYSNVIVPVGDRRFYVLGAARDEPASLPLSCATQPEPMSILELEEGVSPSPLSAPTPPSQDIGAVAHPAGGVFAGLQPTHRDFVVRVAERVLAEHARRRLPRPWSVAELRLTDADRVLLSVWGKAALWDWRRDEALYSAVPQSLSPRQALGLTFLLFAAEVVRLHAGAGVVWPAVLDHLGAAQRELFLATDNIPRPALRAALYAPEYGPVQLQVLLNNHSNKMYSYSFAQAWESLAQVRRGQLGREGAREQWSANAWTAHLPIDELWTACLAGPREGPERSGEDAEQDAEAAYRFLSEPMLIHAEIGEPAFRFELARAAPSWLEERTAMFDLAGRRALVARESDGTWRFLDGALDIPLRTAQATLRMDVLVRKRSVLPEPAVHALLPECGFAFFRTSGTSIDPYGTMPVNETLYLLHPTATVLQGAPEDLHFQAVLLGTYRLTRLRAGVAQLLTLLTETGDALWQASAPVGTVEKQAVTVDVPGGRWGECVALTIPSVNFTPERLLAASSYLPLTERGGRVLADTELSQELGRVRMGRLYGRAGVQRKSAPVAFRKMGRLFGAALEENETWRSVRATDTLDAARLRLGRLRGELRKEPVATNTPFWAEADRMLAQPSRLGVVLSGCYGLGEPLCLVPDTWNRDDASLKAAAAVIDTGDLRDVRSDGSDQWHARWPYEEPFSPEHGMWVWLCDQPGPTRLPESAVRSEGGQLFWTCMLPGPHFGWALSFRGRRLGSCCYEAEWERFSAGVPRQEWQQTASWLRWWHAPVLRPAGRSTLRELVVRHPVETCLAWLLPNTPAAGVTQDDQREDAWSAALRSLLWKWTPNPEASAALLSALDIWTGDPAHDLHPQRACVARLLHAHPVLLVKAACAALTAFYPEHAAHHAVLLRCLAGAVHPRAGTLSPGECVKALIETSVEVENGMDSHFVRQLLGELHTFAGGQAERSGKLRTALHWRWMRELGALSLLETEVQRREGTAR